MDDYGASRGRFAETDDERELAPGEGLPASCKNGAAFQERSFAADVRSLIDGRQVLFHGTRFAREILAEDRLR